jgi:hypothetical protein
MTWQSLGVGLASARNSLRIAIISSTRLVALIVQPATLDRRRRRELWRIFTGT